MNPYKDIHIYGNDFANKYRQNLTESPHVFAVANAAYNQMMRGEWILVSPFWHLLRCIGDILNIFFWLASIHQTNWPCL